MLGKLLPLVPLFLVATGFSFAQESHNSFKKDSVHCEQEEALEEVVFTATRTPKLLKDQPVCIQVISPQQIKLISPKSFIDLLEYTLPGVEFTKHGGQDILSYRGFDSNSFLFLIDGDPITTGTGREIDFSRINPDNIEKIEIIRGAGSALYGSNALAAVVNIITKHSNKQISGSFLGFFDSKKNQRYNANIAFNISKLRSITDAGYSKDQPYTIADEKMTQRKVYGGHVLNLNEKLIYTPNHDLKLKLDLLYNNRRQKRGDLLDYEYNSFDLKLGGIWRFSERQNIDLSYSFNIYKQDSVLKKSKITPRKVVFNELMHYIRAQYNFDISAQHQLNLGGEYNFDRVTSPRLSSPEVPGAKSLNTGVIYGQYQYTPLEELVLCYGGRLDMRERYGVHYTNRLSARYTPNNHYSFRANFSQGYRTPSMQELFFFFDHMGMFYIYGNENLKPERSNMFLLSGEYNNEWLNMVISGYYNKVFNQIALQSKEGANGNLSYYYVNSPKNDRGNIWGIDFNTKIRLPFGFDLRASYAYSYNHYLITMQDGSAYVDKNGHNVYTTYTRPHSLVGSLKWHHHFSKHYRLTANFSIRYLSSFSNKQLVKKDDTLENYEVKDLKYQSATLAKLSCEQNFFDHYELLLGVDNLFNYLPNNAVFNAPLSPGRSYFGTIRIAF